MQNRNIICEGMRVLHCGVFLSTDKFMWGAYEHRDKFTTSSSSLRPYMSTVNSVSYLSFSSANNTFFLSYSYYVLRHITLFRDTVIMFYCIAVLIYSAPRFFRKALEFYFLAAQFECFWYQLFISRHNIFILHLTASIEHHRFLICIPVVILCVTILIYFIAIVFIWTLVFLLLWIAVFFE